jgi:hypothetical protein
MTINHILPKKNRITPYDLISFIMNKGKFKYTIKLSKITLVDILVYGLKTGILNFSNS